MQVVKAGHPSANTTAPATRNMPANFGVGTARRETPNMLPYRDMQITLGGATQPRWRQSAATESKQGVLPRSRAKDVLVRSSNGDPTAIGLADQEGFNWGIAGFGDAQADVGTGLSLTAIAALGVAAWLLLK